MTQEQVNAMLREYRGLIGRCGHIDAEILRLERAIQAVKAQFERDLAAPPVSRLDGLPRGTALSDPTQRAALALAEGRAFEDSEAGAEARRLGARIEALCAERGERRLRAQFVESWLSGLPDRERWVIERHIIDGEIWHDIIAQFNRRYDDDISLDRIKRIQKRALSRIYDMAA